MPSTQSSSSRSGRRRKAPARAKKKAESTESEESTLRPQWSGTLSFGLVSIPVDLYPATRTARVALRMITSDGTPIKRRFARPDEDTEVPSAELVRGYEWKPGKYVQVTDEELEALEPDKSRDIDLRLFVAADSLDPIYFERTYFLLPSGDSNKAYHLLATVMEKGKRAGIATFVMRDREYLVAIFAKNGILMAEALRFHEEVRDGSGIGLPSKARVDAKAVKQLETLIGKHAHDRFDPDSIHNEHNEALRKLAQSKAKKHKDVVQSSEAEPEEDGEAETVDLMRMLKQSLAS